MHADRVAPEKTVFSARPAVVLFPAERKEKRVAKISYSDQLKHPNWQRRRLEILQRDDFTCQVCMNKDETLHVHHKQYVKGRAAWEYAEHELVTLCASCHEAMHEQNDRMKALFALLPVDGPFSIGDAIGMVAGWANFGKGHDLQAYKEENEHSFLIGWIAGFFADNIHWTDDLQSLLPKLQAIVDEVTRHRKG